MTRPDTLHEMESLLASIREAIETETGAAQPGASGHERASAAPSAPAPSEMDWQAAHGDDDILWADETGVDAHAPTGQTLHDREALTSAPAEAPVTNPGPKRPAWATSPPAAAPVAGRGAPSAGAGAMSASARRTARLRLVKTDATEQASATPAGEPPAAAPSFLSQKVRERVRAAMARQKRIEEAKRALGGEQALRQLVSDIVEPIIAEWLNEHLPDIVERRVARELARLREHGE